MSIQLALSQRTLKTLLHYDGRTGDLTWIVDRGRTAHAGDEAGSVNRITGFVTVVVQGKTYLAQRLIWLYMTGDWPAGRLTFKDGDRENLRWTNIIAEADTLSTAPSAVYQRNLRQRRKQMISAGSLRDPDRADTRKFTRRFES